MCDFLTLFPQLVQGGYWCVALSCGLYSVFMKCDWYRSDEPATEAIRMVSSFADRILWSLCMAWFVFACTTGRAGEQVKVHSDITPLVFHSLALNEDNDAAVFLLLL